MQVDRFSVTMDPELGAAVRNAAEQAGSSVSAWLAAAASDRLRNQLLGSALDAWESETSPFSEAELEEAARRIGVRRRASRSSRSTA